MASALTLADAKTHLNITVATYDTELQAVIDSAESLIAQRCGPLASTATTATFVPGNGVAELVLPVTPVVSLTSVTPNVGSAITIGLLSATPWGTVRYTTTSSFGLFYAAWYTVVYQAGRTSVPSGLLFAIKELVRHLWVSQQGAGRPGNAAASGGVQFAAQVGAFPTVVIEAMLPFEQPGFA